jgi:serine/threonine protein kinase
MAVLIGQTLGPYQVIELVGQGAIATVYKAYHPKLDRYVAIKVIASDYAQEPDFLESFSREAQIIAQLDHPHILPFYDFGRQGDICYIVMKYMPGCLSDRLGQPLPWLRQSGLSSKLPTLWITRTGMAFYTVTSNRLTFLLTRRTGFI